MAENDATSTLTKLGLPVDAFPGVAVPLAFSVLALEATATRLNLDTVWGVPAPSLHAAIVILGGLLALIAYVAGDFWDNVVFDTRYGSRGKWRNRSDRPFNVLPGGRQLAEARTRAASALDTQSGIYRKARRLLNSRNAWNEVAGPLIWSKAFRSLIWPSLLLAATLAVWSVGAGLSTWTGRPTGLGLAALGFCLFALLMFLPYISLRVEHMIRVYELAAELGVPEAPKPESRHRSGLTRSLGVGGAHDHARPERDDPPKRWHDDLERGHLTLELSGLQDSGNEMFTLMNVVAAVLGEVGFRDVTARRAKLILRELLTNVARHADDDSAWIMIKIQQKYFRIVSIAVSDSGPGIPDDVLDDQSRGLARGEPVHGLMLVRQLASSLHHSSPPEAPADKAHSVWCDLYEPELAQSVLFDFAEVGAVRMEYSAPKVFWIGSEEAYVDAWRGDAHGTFTTTLAEAVSDDLRPLLDLYFADLARSSLLAVEITGREFETEVRPGAFYWLRTALERYFDSFFEAKSVILLAHDTSPSVMNEVRAWAQRQEVQHFESEDDCRAYLARLQSDGT